MLEEAVVWHKGKQLVLVVPVAAEMEEVPTLELQIPVAVVAVPLLEAGILVEQVVLEWLSFATRQHWLVE